jgi:hypothetical protein
VKICRKCQIPKPYTAFGQHRKGYLRETCNDCRATQEREKYHANIQRFRAYECARKQKRRQTDPKANILSKCRTRLWRALKGYVKHSHTLTLIGCSLDDLIKHIKNKFTTGMTWELFMQGKIHLDHIKPCSAFDLSVPEQQAQCFHYLNLQPLWAKDNLSKGSAVQ